MTRPEAAAAARLGSLLGGALHALLPLLLMALAFALVRRLLLARPQRLPLLLAALAAPAAFAALAALEAGAAADWVIGLSAALWGALAACARWCPAGRGDGAPAPGAVCAAALAAALASGGWLPRLAPLLALPAALLLLWRSLRPAPREGTAALLPCSGPAGLLAAVSMFVTMAGWPLAQSLCRGVPGSIVLAPALHLLAMLLPWAPAAWLAPPDAAACERRVTALLAAGALLALAGTPAAGMGAMLVQAMAWSCSVRPGRGRAGAPPALPPGGLLALLPAAALALSLGGLAVIQAVQVAVGVAAMAHWLAQQAGGARAAARSRFETVAAPAWSAKNGGERRAAVPPCT